MKASTYLIVILAFSFSCLSWAGHTQSISKNEIDVLAGRLKATIEERNFAEARNVMEELMPLMKEVLKSDKKRFSELKKSDNPEINPDEFEKQMERKNELYNSLKKLVNISPAALRVKAKLVLSEVVEFAELS